jgi:hypothetical protein
LRTEYGVRPHDFDAFPNADLPHGAMSQGHVSPQEGPQVSAGNLLGHSYIGQ